MVHLVVCHKLCEIVDDILVDDLGHLGRHVLAYLGTGLGDDYWTWLTVYLSEVYET